MDRPSFEANLAWPAQCCGVDILLHNDVCLTAKHVSIPNRVVSRRVSGRLRRPGRWTRL
jgi:hypothetical protein